jgi:hypothetical protein
MLLANNPISRTIWTQASINKTNNPIEDGKISSQCTLILTYRVSCLFVYQPIFFFSI